MYYMYYMYICYIIYMYIYIYVLQRKGVQLGKTLYLPTSFGRRLLQGRKIYSQVICNVG